MIKDIFQKLTSEKKVHANDSMIIEAIKKAKRMGLKGDDMVHIVSSLNQKLSKREVVKLIKKHTV
ncbi:MAG: hypothetical protein H6622_00225 [Halobacteriovoraceae bacterium]|nr:hypothetical protein [Halobacteriovoraceae bacterium]